MNVTEAHLHHVVKRSHKLAERYNALTSKLKNVGSRFVSTGEVAVGAFAGGLLEGRTENGGLGPVPWNLGAGVLLLAAGHSPFLGAYGNHANNVANGLIGSYIATKGFNFGKRWKDTGSLRGGFSGDATQVKGELDPAHMQNVIRNMAAAAQP